MRQHHASPRTCILTDPFPFGIAELGLDSGSPVGREIGFRKIAGTELICRQSTLRSRFSEQYPRGHDVDVVGRPEFEQWVLEQWQKEELD